jgi:hypothetical protein
MSAIKSGEQNVAKGDAKQAHPERRGQLGGDWEEKNQGEARQGPGHQGSQAPKNQHVRGPRTPEDEKRYLLQESPSRKRSH